MSKKLLSEAQIKRFQSLANLPVVTEMYAKNEEEMEEGMHGEEKKEAMHEEEEMEMDAEMDDMDMPEEEPEMDEMGSELDLSEEEARLLIDLGKKLEAIMGAVEAGEDMPAEEEPMPMDDEDEDEAPVGDMLEGVSPETSRKEIVEEVARRVAKRLNEAKTAQKALDKALGNK